jgi:hypothetical protein
MSKLPLALRELHRSETRLARDLLAVSDRHRADQEIHHVARDLARWSQTHVRCIAEAGRDYGTKLRPQPRWSTNPLSTLVQRAGHRHSPAPPTRARSAALGRPAPPAPHRGGGLPGLGATRPSRPGHAGTATARPGPALPSQNVTPDALGQRTPQNRLTPGPRLLTRQVRVTSGARGRPPSTTERARGPGPARPGPTLPGSIIHRTRRWERVLRSANDASRCHHPSGPRVPPRRSRDVWPSVDHSPFSSTSPCPVTIPQTGQTRRSPSALPR